MGTSRTYIILFTLHLISIMAAQEMDKRGPQGFLGMRGKKLSDDLTETEQFYKRRPQFFVGVKGKKSSLDEILESEEPNYKRSLNIGVPAIKYPFINPKFNPENYMPKEGSLIGKIDYTSANDGNMDPYPVLLGILNEFLHKIQVMTREKMDSKLEEEDDERISYDDIVKRAANIHQFFGVRGKKSIQDKRPYDVTFRGKFIGVRGKKDLKNNEAQEIRFLYDQNAPLPKRKGQMGFIGMRGKKWSDDSSPEETPK